MALSTFVKISNVSNLSDARYCAGMMVDIIGFDIDPTGATPVLEADFKEITEWVAGVQYAGEFHGATTEEIKETLKHYPVDYIQIQKLDQIEEIQLLGKPIVYKLYINSSTELEAFKGTLSYLDELATMIIIRSDNEEIYDAIDASIGYYNGNLKLLKGFGLQPSSSLAKFPGIEMEATEEDRPGFKDFGQIMDVLELIEED